MRAMAQPMEQLEILYSSIANDPSSSLPGLPGITIFAIDRPGVSPDGSHWIIPLILQTGTVADNKVIVVDGAVVARKGEAPSYLPAGRVHENFAMGVHILNSGAYSFGGDFSGSMGTDDFVCRGDGLGNIAMVANQSIQIAGAPAGWLAGVLVNSFVTQGGVAYESEAVTGGPPVGMDNVLMLNGSILLQTGVDAPVGQLTGLSDAWESFDQEFFWVSSDGAHYILRGDLAGPTGNDNVTVVDGVVVVQELLPLPGGVPTDLVQAGTFGTTSVFMSENGNWMAKGTFVGSLAGWALYNGAMVARGGNPIHVGAAETYVGGFHSVTCNNVGDYVIAGFSNAPAATDTVVVLNNDHVVLREGDPVDLDGNGLLDDNLFVSAIETDDLVLTDDLRLFLTGRLKNASNADKGPFFGFLQLDSPAVGVPFCDPADPNSTGSPAVLSGTMSGLGTSGLHLEARQGPPNQFGYFLVGTGAASPGVVLSQGHFCLATNLGNTIGRYNIPGGVLNSVGVFDPSGTLLNAVGTSSVGSGFDVPSALPTIGGSIQTGETWHFQLWFRENAGASNLTNGLSVTF